MRRVGDELRVPAEHLLPPADVLVGEVRIGAEVEPVQEMRADVGILGVHGGDHQRVARILARDTFPLNDHATARHAVQKRGEHPLIQQIDVVHVQDVPVCLGQHALLHHRTALAHGRLRVHAAEEHLLGDVQRDVHHALPDQSARGPRQDGLGGSRAPADQHRAYGRIDRRAEDRPLGVVHPVHGGEREAQISCRHLSSSSWSKASSSNGRLLMRWERTRFATARMSSLVTD